MSETTERPTWTPRPGKALVLRTSDGATRVVSAGDVEHLR